MKRYLYLCLTLIVIFVFSACGSDSASDTPTTVPETTIPTTIAIVETVLENTEPTELLETLYEKDAHINLFLNRYNAANPENPITADNFETYHHHGRDHDDQIKIYGEIFDISASSLSYRNQIKVVINGKSENSFEDYRRLFNFYARAYSIDLDSTTLDSYWQQLLDATINSVDFSEFSCDLTIYNDVIEMMVFEGSVE